MRISDWSSDVCSSDLDIGDILVSPEFDRPAAQFELRLKTAKPAVPGIFAETPVVLMNTGVDTDLPAPAAQQADERFEYLSLEDRLFDTVFPYPEGRIMKSDLSLARVWSGVIRRSEEHTSELQSLMRISYA